MSRFGRRGLLLGCLACCLAGCGGEDADRPTVTLGAAASLRRVLPDLVEAYADGTPRVTIDATYGASGLLRQSVEGGAPLDGVLFAGHAHLDRLVDRGHVDPESRRVVASNALVLVGPVGGPSLTFRTLGDAPAGEKIAIGDPKSVPAGAYAKQAFEALGSWSALEDRFALCQDVAQVLAWVRRAEVSAGVVYATETIGVDDIVILDEAAGDWAPRPEVVVGVVSGARQAEVAGAFFDFLRSARGRAILARHGFTPAEP